MCTDEKLSYNTFPAGHIFRLGIAILVLTGNCVVMRVAATMALLSTRESQAYCQVHQTACSVTALSVLGSVLPILVAVLTGSFAIVAAKRYLKWAFIVTFVLGCILMTVSFLLNLLFNGLRHGFNIAPVLVPDILEINLFCVINLLTMVAGIMCVKSLVRDRSERYAVAAGTAAELDGAVAETSIGRGWPDEADGDGVGSSGIYSNYLGPPPTEHHHRDVILHRSGSSRSDNRVEAAELAVVVENESGKVTNYDIFTVAGDGGRRSN